MKKILVIRYGTIGDSIFASAFYRELRRALPDAQIDILTDDIAEGVMHDCPYIDNIHKIKGKYKNLLHYIHLLSQYNTVYFLKNDNFFTKAAFISGIKNRIGFDVKRNKFLTLKLPYNEDRHEIDCYLDLLMISGIQVKSDKTELWLNNDSNKKVKELIKSVSGKKILIQAYSRFPQKNWIDDYWVEIITYISEKLKGQVFLAGSEKDAAKYQHIIDELDSKIEIMPVNLSGKLSISETMSFVNNMDIIIGIDSGIIHMAAALNIPSILLHGPTSLVRWKPRSKNCKVLTKQFSCSPCCLQSNVKRTCQGEHSYCMDRLTPDILIETLEEMFLAAKIF